MATSSPVGPVSVCLVALGLWTVAACAPAPPLPLFPEMDVPKHMARTRWAVEIIRTEDRLLLRNPQWASWPKRTEGTLVLDEVFDATADGRMVVLKGFSTADPHALIGYRPAYAVGSIRMGVRKVRLDWMLTIPPACGDCGLIYHGRMNADTFVGTWSTGGYATIEWGQVRLRRIG